MILATIEYDDDLGFGGNRLTLIADLLEPLLGSILEEELEDIDLRFRPYGIHDIYESPILFTIDVDSREVHHKLSTLVDQLQFGIQDMLVTVLGHVETPRFRIWIRSQLGSYT